MNGRDRKPGFGGRQGNSGYEGKHPQSEPDLIEEEKTATGSHRPNVPTKGRSSRRDFPKASLYEAKPCKVRVSLPRTGNAGRQDSGRE
jgi:hypothetical protein